MGVLMTIQMRGIDTGGETLFNLGAEFSFNFNKLDAAPDRSFDECAIGFGKNALRCECGDAFRRGNGIFCNQSEMNANSK